MAQDRFGLATKAQDNRKGAEQREERDSCARSIERHGRPFIRHTQQVTRFDCHFAARKRLPDGWRDGNEL